MRSKIVKAIVYTSNTGYTKKYALLLAEATLLPVYSLDEAKTRINSKDEVVYLGWIFAGKIKGLKQAKKKYLLKAVAAVGMAEYSGEYEKMIREGNALPETGTFYLQGGFDFAKLKGINRFIMGMMANMFKKKKEELTPEDQTFLEMFETPSDFVSIEKLRPLINYLEKGQE